MTLSRFKSATLSKIETIENRLKYSEKPMSRDINSTLFYINGLNTSINKAEENRQYVQRYFTPCKTSLIYNGTSGILKDLLNEARYDLRWAKKYIHNKGSNFDSISTPAYEVLAILQIAKKKNLPIGLVASSQGGLMTFNAIGTFLQLDKTNIHFLKKNVRFCYVGSVLPKANELYLSLVLNKFISCINKKDPLSKFVRNLNIKDGSDIIQLYKFFLKGLILHAKNEKYHWLKYYLPWDNHVKKYYRKKTKLNENEPFVKKDFFLTPKLNPSEFGVQDNWLIPVLNSVFN